MMLPRKKKAGRPGLTESSRRSCRPRSASRRGSCCPPRKRSSAKKGGRTPPPPPLLFFVYAFFRQTLSDTDAGADKAACVLPASSIPTESGRVFFFALSSTLALIATPIATSTVPKCVMSCSHQAVGFVSRCTSTLK